MELYKKYRPKTLKDVVGQDVQIKVLENKLKNNTLPHTLLLIGPSGCGKTTIARILRRELGCGRHDFEEMNAANERGIDPTREIQSRMNAMPLDGKCRVWLIDESQQLTGPAQSNLLKTLEDTPNHVYFMLATTDPQKLLRTIRTRCMEITIQPLRPKQLEALLKKVLNAEEVEVAEEVLEKIIEHSDGSARKALVLLDQVYKLESEEEMLDVVRQKSAEVQAIQIARTLFNPKAKWGDVAKILQGLENEDVEQIRWLILSYSNSILKKGGPLSGLAYLIIEAFKENFFNSKMAGLTAACYTIVTGK